MIRRRFLPALLLLLAAPVAAQVPERVICDYEITAGLYSVVVGDSVVSRHAQEREAILSMVLWQSRYGDVAPARLDRPEIEVICPSGWDHLSYRQSAPLDSMVIYAGDRSLSENVLDWWAVEGGWELYVLDELLATVGLTEGYPLTLRLWSGDDVVICAGECGGQRVGTLPLLPDGRQPVLRTRSFGAVYAMIARATDG